MAEAEIAGSPDKETALKERLSYCHITGNIFWTKDKRNKFKGKKVYSLCGSGYLRVKIFGTYLKAHRVAWFLHHGYWPDKLLDHKDGNKKNNSLKNLRCVNSKQNSHNRKTLEGQTFKGVDFIPNLSKYRARIYFDNKRLLLGYYHSPEQAAFAYNEAAIKCYGEYARLNDLS